MLNNSKWFTIPFIMKNTYVTLKTFLILCLLLSSAVVSAQAADDWQYWNEFQLSYKVQDKWGLKIAGEQRMVDDFSILGLTNVTAGTEWQALRFLDLGAYYKFENDKSPSGAKNDEHRHYWQATLKTKRGSFFIKDRNRMEYRNKKTKDGWRYRNQIQIGYAIPYKQFVFTPYLSEEFFYDTVAGEINQNRVAIGVSTKLSPHIKIATYYLLKSNRSGRDWNESNALGTNLALSF